jgi:hypothetical protein
MARRGGPGRKKHDTIQYDTDWNTHCGRQGKSAPDLQLCTAYAFILCKSNRAGCELPGLDLCMPKAPPVRVGSIRMLPRPSPLGAVTYAVACPCVKHAWEAQSCVCACAHTSCCCGCQQVCCLTTKECLRCFGRCLLDSKVCGAVVSVATCRLGWWWKSIDCHSVWYRIIPYVTVSCGTSNRV